MRARLYAALCYLCIFAAGFMAGELAMMHATGVLP